VTTLYFSYGSNLSLARMRERGLPAAGARPAVLRDHRLVFDKPGRDGAARANVRLAPGGRVHGVVYAISRDDLDRLRQFEGGYDLEEALVEAGRPDGGVDILAVRLFVARGDGRGLAPPSRLYVETILEGIRDHRLPPEAATEVRRAVRDLAGDGAATSRDEPDATGPGRTRPA